MKVFAAIIEHKHGTDLYLAETADLLETELFAYVEEWWEAEIGEDKEMPTDPREAVETYFDYMADRVGGEFLTRFGETEVTRNAE